MADGEDTLEHIRFFFRIWLMNHAHIALSCGSGLIGVNPGNDNQLIPRILLNLHQAVYIVANGFFIICGTGADNYQKFTAFPSKYFFYFLVSFLFESCKFWSQWKLLSDFCRGRQQVNKCKSHIVSPPIVPPGFLSGRFHLNTLSQCFIIV